MSQQSVSNNQSAGVGGILREAREAKGMSIASAAMHTNLRKDIIEKLENNQFGEIGAPVFTRGYLNIYARFLEVDEDLVAREFSAVAQPRAEQSLRINSANIESQGKPYKRSMARGWISLLLVLLIGGGVIAQLLDDDSWLLQQIRGTFTETVSTEVVEQIEQPEADVQEPEFTVEVENTQLQSDIPSLTSVEGVALESDTTQDMNGTEGLALSSLDGDLAANDQTSLDTEAQDSAAAAQKEMGKATLKTSEENWIEIRGGDGKVISSQIYSAGSEIELTAEAGPYRLNIGRPTAITLTINGENKPLADYRNKGQTRLFNLSIPNE
ncbi:DUF4115 domain-containing protein [Cardiobacteriaceae bacterium TAE3-ERU3]|nr:DUF4115 domain-containing protein [Cardiobacteriaceae bacterium TAE3-ERU3]